MGKHERVMAMDEQGRRRKGNLKWRWMGSVKDNLRYGIIVSKI